MKKNILLIILIILVLILIILSSFNLYKGSKDTTFSYLILQTDTLTEDLIDCRQILTFDKNDICIDDKILLEFKEENSAQKQYENWLKSSENSSSISNISKNGTTITCHRNVSKGSHKSEFLNSSANTYIEI